MQEHMDDWSTISDKPFPKKSRTRPMFLRFLFGVLGSVMLITAAAAAIIPKLTYNSQQTRADSSLSSTQGHIKLSLDPNAGKLTIQATISSTPPNTPLAMDVLNGSCTGSSLFSLQATSDYTGYASANMTFDDLQDTTIPSDWFFNVSDTTRQAFNGTALSIACGTIQVDSSGLIGHARLSPIQPQDQGLIAASTTQGQAKLHLDPNLHILVVQANISGAPPNTPLAMDILSGSCTGSTLFPLQATSDNTGYASATMIFSDQQDVTISSNWFFNIYDITRQAFNGNTLSIACGAIQVDSSGLTGHTQLNPVQQQGLNLTTESTTQGLTTLQLNPAAHTLAIQALIFSAPPNTPLVMHIHGGGSCTGPILFQLQTTSDSQGHGIASMTFNDQQDSTIPSDWFFNVHDTTRQGPDGKPLSIACGPVQTIDPTIAFAKLAPVQPSPIQPTPISSVNPTTPTLSTTEGLTTLQLNPNTHTLTIQANIFGAPPSTPLAMDVRNGSCTGPTIPLPMQATSDFAGNASVTSTFNDSQDTTIPQNWFFSVDDTTKQGLDGQPVSIACAPIQVVDPSDQIAYALLCPVQSNQVTPLTPPPTSSTVPTGQSTTQGLSVLLLNAAKHILNVLVRLVGAPPNTPLGLDIHGASCTGPTLFMIPATSNSGGNATAVMPFTDQQNTTIPQNWFFSVHVQGPNGQSFSIACGPIVTPGQVGLAQLSPQ